VGHFLPGLRAAIGRLPDPRRPERCVYGQAHLVWLGILLFLMHLGSRRQMRLERRAAAFADNMARLCGQGEPDTVADPDTLAYYAERLPAGPLERLLAGMSARLIRMKALDAFRLGGFFTVAIDGSQICTFDSEPWPGCPRRRLGSGAVQYFAYVLDAKLVSPCGMALSLASEMLTNEGNASFDKQDCERKALGRLLEKLRGLFPRTPFCLLLDALHAHQNAIRQIAAMGWKYIITFKEGSMPERFAEALALAGLQRDNRLHLAAPKADQDFEWVQGLPIAEFSPNVLFCHHRPHGEEPTRFVWLTNFHLCRHNVPNIANQGGRLRWKIENEGFNVQKNHGFGMEHPYSEHPNGFRIFYLLLLVAHYITQLILHGSLIESLRESFGSARNFARRLAESMRNDPDPGELTLPGQIRFRPP
jgi:hypothetical protein